MFRISCYKSRDNATLNERAATTPSGGRLYFEVLAGLLFILVAMIPINKSIVYIESKSLEICILKICTSMLLQNENPADQRSLFNEDTCGLRFDMPWSN